MPTTNTLLRYPGGKSSLTDTIAKVFQYNGLKGGTYIEPYAGGAGIAINLLMSGVASRIVLNDADRAIASFWRLVSHDPAYLADKIKTTPITLDEWHRQREVFHNKEKANDQALGFATFFLNRCNRSGILAANPIGGINQTGDYKLDARFPKQRLLALLKDIARLSDRIVVKQEDALTLLSDVSEYATEKHLVFIDPPYFEKGSQLYMNHYKPDDHAAIAEKIHDLPPHCNWVVTYDDIPQITALYRSKKVRRFDLHYHSHDPKVGNEIFIAPHRLRVPRRITISHKVYVRGPETERTYKNMRKAKNKKPPSQIKGVSIE